MLRTLTIRNYALIENLELEFGEGLTIITGETGAGKSIMLGALGLVMGGRADTKVIADQNAKSVVEATFTDIDPELEAVCSEKGIEWTKDPDGLPEITVRRELSASGRSKVYINDTGVTLQTLQQIASKLIDIHSQHANAKINDPSERLTIIDSIAANGLLRKEYRGHFERYVDLRRRIRRHQEETARNNANLGYLQFQLARLDRLKPKEGELSAIEKKFDLLTDAEEIQERLARILNLLGESGRGVAENLAEATGLAEKTDFSIFQSTAPEDVKLADEEPIVERLKKILIEVKDISETIEDYASSINSDPHEAARLSERMNLYYETVKEFRVKEADELTGLHKEIRRRLEEAGGNDEVLPALERECRATAQKLKELASELTETRKRAALSFSNALLETARPLGLANMAFETAITKGKATSEGQDEVEFLATFNKGGDLQPVQEIASGGEISRMMLSMKSIIAGHINLPTIIFDEVDTGVSGEIADKMGRMMRAVSEKMQVIVITHLPQVAAQGDRHLKVYKTDTGSRTVTHVMPLTKEGRIRELASMISGSEVTPGALKAARELLRGKKLN